MQRALEREVERNPDLKKAQEEHERRLRVIEGRSQTEAQEGSNSQLVSEQVGVEQIDVDQYGQKRNSDEGEAQQRKKSNRPLVLLPGTVTPVPIPGTPPEELQAQRARDQRQSSQQASKMNVSDAATHYNISSPKGATREADEGV